MCGSLITKLASRNKVDPVRTTFPDPKRKKSNTAKEGDDCYENKEFWKNNDYTGDSSIHSKLSASFKNSMKNGGRSTSGSSSQQEVKLTMRALNHSKSLLPAINTTPVTAQKRVQRDLQHLLESAREILGLQANVASSNSNDVTLKSFSSIDSSKPIIKTTLAFDIPVTKQNTVCPNAIGPLRLRNRRRVAPEKTLEDGQNRIGAAEERKLKELEWVRETATSKTCISRQHPSELCTKATKEKTASKQAAAEKKRKEQIENRKQAGNTVSQKISKIVEAKVLAKTQLRYNIGHAEDETETEKRKEIRQQKSDRKKKQKQLQEKYAKTVKEKVSSSLI